MRVLLDESLPHELASELTGHTIDTVQGRGWAGTKNGSLLRLAEKDYDVFLTADQNLPHQQNLPTFEIAVVILAAKRNRMNDIRSLMPELLAAIESGTSGQAIWVRASR